MSTHHQVVIVTTTIQPPTVATKRFCEIADKNEWPFLIVGDTKTPHDKYQALVDKHDYVYYITPEEQEEKCKELSDTIGWKSIQRRNVGFVIAYHQFPNAEWIATVDDDNIPHDGWGDELRTSTHIQKLNLGPVDIFDPLTCVNMVDRHTGKTLSDFKTVSPFWHRGFPIELKESRNDTHTRTSIIYDEGRGVVSKGSSSIGVYAPMWDGDPDIDALCRLTSGPDVRISHLQTHGETVLGFFSHALAPFNSQNTFIKREWIPFYAVFPHVGRMDDIWGGYHLQKIMRAKKADDRIVYGSATVTQERNEQDLITNLEKEVIGYRHTLEFINEPIDDSFLLPDVDYIPEDTKEFYKAYRNSFDV